MRMPSHFLMNTMVHCWAQCVYTNIPRMPPQNVFYVARGDPQPRTSFQPYQAKRWRVLVDMLVYHPPPNPFQSLLWYATSQCSANAAMQLTQTSPCRKEHSWFSSWTASTQRLSRASAYCAVGFSWLPSLRSAPTVQGLKVFSVDCFFC